MQKYTAHTHDPRGQVEAGLVSQLREANLFGAFTDVTTPRFMKFCMQPKTIMRSGWLLDPNTEVEQPQTRSYLLRTLPEGQEDAVTQRLDIDRTARQAVLTTSGRGHSQQIRVDMQSFQVLSNDAE